MFLALGRDFISTLKIFPTRLNCTYIIFVYDKNDMTWWIKRKWPILMLFKNVDKYTECNKVHLVLFFPFWIYILSPTIYLCIGGWNIIQKTLNFDSYTFIYLIRKYILGWFFKSCCLKSWLSFIYKNCSKLKYFQFWKLFKC